MKVRLKKDAPWESVISPDGQTIDKIVWLNEETDIRPFTKYIEYQLEESDVDYDTDIQQLISIAENNNIYAYLCSREDLIKKLKDNKVSMPKVEKQKIETINYSSLSKSELANIAEAKGILVKGLSKAKLLEALQNE